MLQMPVDLVAVHVRPALLGDGDDLAEERLVHERPGGVVGVGEHDEPGPVVGQAPQPVGIRQVAALGAQWEHLHLRPQRLRHRVQLLVGGSHADDGVSRLDQREVHEEVGADGAVRDEDAIGRDGLAVEAGDRLAEIR